MLYSLYFFFIRMKRFTFVEHLIKSHYPHRPIKLPWMQKPLMPLSIKLVISLTNFQVKMLNLSSVKPAIYLSQTKQEHLWLDLMQAIKTCIWLPDTHFGGSWIPLLPVRWYQSICLMEKLAAWVKTWRVFLFLLKELKLDFIVIKQCPFIHKKNTFKILIDEEERINKWLWLILYNYFLFESWMKVFHRKFCTKVKKDNLSSARIKA